MVKWTLLSNLKQKSKEFVFERDLNGFQKTVFINTFTTQTNLKHIVPLSYMQFKTKVKAASWYNNDMQIMTYIP